MVPRGFVVAMHGTFLRAAVTAAWPRGAGEWMIVSRWGIRGAFLTIARTFSFTSVAPGAADEPPAGITPFETFVGVHARATDVETGCVFLLADSPPTEVHLAGAFRPASGFALVRGEGADLELLASVEVGGERWRMRALRRPWLGETLVA
jgi:hypothetical protein